MYTNFTIWRTVKPHLATTEDDLSSEVYEILENCTEGQAQDHCNELYNFANETVNLADGNHQLYSFYFERNSL